MWGVMWHQFHLPSFYYTIVSLFEDDPTDPWVVDTLKFWNKYVGSGSDVDIY
jgi:hypothetical protein